MRKKRDDEQLTDLSCPSNISDYISFRNQICSKINRHDEKLYLRSLTNQVLSCPRNGNGLKQYTVSICLIILRNYFGDEEGTEKQT